METQRPVCGWRVGALQDCGGFGRRGKERLITDTATSSLTDSPTNTVQYKEMLIRGVKGLKSEFSMLVTMVTHADHISWSTAEHFH